MRRLTGYMTQSAAATAKRVSRRSVALAIQAGRLDAVRTGPYVLVVANDRFKQWGVNRTRQRRIRAGLKRLREGIPSPRRPRVTKGEGARP